MLGIPPDRMWTLDTNCRDLAGDVINPIDGTPSILPASYYATTTQEERSLLCVRHGLYVLPTVELIDSLRCEIANRAAIEIGSGNGAVARALGITATDNRMQEWPEIAAMYESAGQRCVRYGANVETLDGEEAVIKYRPKVIVGCWITHKYRPEHHARGGNMFAPDELFLLANCETLILVGNNSTHSKHPLLKIPHLHVTGNWLYSRARDPGNFLGIWQSSVLS